MGEAVFSKPKHHKPSPMRKTRFMPSDLLNIEKLGDLAESKLI